MSIFEHSISFHPWNKMDDTSEITVLSADVLYMSKALEMKKEISGLKEALLNITLHLKLAIKTNFE
jgi:hypothetical protein